MKIRLLAPFLMAIFLFACKKNTTEPSNTIPPSSVSTLYIPPSTGSDWQTSTPGSLGWNESELNNLYTYLDSKNTKAFIILKNGKNGC